MVCRLALAALLIIGPVFIVLALFEGTRGLFEGWLKSVAMFAFVPLLTVVMGSGALVAIAPMVSGLDGSGRRTIPMRTAVSILVAAIIYVSLMLLVLKVAANLTRGWRLGRGSPVPMPAFAGGFVASASGTAALAPAPAVAATSPTITSDRVRNTVASIEATATSHRISTSAAMQASALPAPASSAGNRRTQGARSQLRYLHHRVAGAPNNNVSREMLR